MENKIHSKNINLLYLILISLVSFLLFFVFLSEKNDEIAAVAQIQNSQGTNESITNPSVSTNTQNFNNLNQQQLVDLIASTISIVNNIDKNKVIQTINDIIESTKAKGGNVIDSLKNIAKFVLNDPSGKVAKNIINAALKAQTASPPPPQTTTTAPPPKTTTAPPPQTTTSLNTQSLKKIDIPELKENLINTKESLVEGDTEEALTGVTDIENQLLKLQNPFLSNKPPFTVEIQNIKDAISMANLKKAIDEVSKIQIEVINAEDEILTANLKNPDLVESQQHKEDKDNDKGGKDNDNGGNGGDGDGGNGGEDKEDN